MGTRASEIIFLIEFKSKKKFLVGGKVVGGGGGRGGWSK